MSRFDYMDSDEKRPNHWYTIDVERAFRTWALPRSRSASSPLA